MANKFVTAIFGDYSKKEVKKLQKTVKKIIEPTITPTIIQTESPEDLEEEEYFDSLEELAICVEAEAGNQDYYGRKRPVIYENWSSCCSGCIY